MDETWLYHYDPEISRLEFWGSRRHHPTDYLPKGLTINAEYYSFLLMQLKDILKEKRRGMVTKVVLFVHDKTPAHRTLATQKKLAYLGCHCMDHPPYSPGSGPVGLPSLD